MIAFTFPFLLVIGFVLVTESRAYALIGDGYTVEIRGGYTLGETGVYMTNGGEKIQGASPTTFEVLGKGYSRDDSHVFYYSKELTTADPDTFEVLEGYYAKDCCTVYVRGEKLPGVDAPSFTTIQYPDNTRVLGKDKNTVYDSSENRMEGIDGATFEFISEFYAKDENGVYIVGTHCGLDGCFTNKKVPEADPATFEVLEHGYAKDHQRVYCRNDEIIENADPASFEVVGDGRIAKDANYTYMYCTHAKARDEYGNPIPGTVLDAEGNPVADF